jgi:hypothetical protein
MNIKEENTATDPHSNMALASHMFEIGSASLNIEIPKNVGLSSIHPKSFSFLRKNNKHNRATETTMGP